MGAASCLTAPQSHCLVAQLLKVSKSGHSKEESSIIFFILVIAIVTITIASIDWLRANATIVIITMTPMLYTGALADHKCAGGQAVRFESGHGGAAQEPRGELPHPLVPLLLHTPSWTGWLVTWIQQIFCFLCLGGLLYGDTNSSSSAYSTSLDE